MSVDLTFGYQNIPDTVTTAWGARTIAHADWLDLLHDRQQADGPRKAELLDYLTAHAEWKLISDQAYKVHDADEIVFYEDDVVIVKGSGQRSSGYCYLVGYFKDEA